VWQVRLFHIALLLSKFAVITPYGP
jgi:hypothetical protein